MATHSSILAWRISWTEKPGRLQSTGLQRVGGNNRATFTFTFQGLVTLVRDSSWEPLERREPCGLRCSLLMVLAFSTSFFFYCPLRNLRKHIFPNPSPPWKCNTTKILYIWLSIFVLCTSKAKISFTHTHPNPTVQEPMLLVVESHPVENSCSWFSKQTQGSFDVQLTLWLQICRHPGNL